MMRRVFCLLLLVPTLAACGLFDSRIAPDELVGQTVIVSLETGAFPNSSIAMQFISSKDVVWRLSGNLGSSSGSADYLISTVNPETILMTWRDATTGITYVITMDFDTRRCFLVRVDQGHNLLSEGVVAIE